MSLGKGQTGSGGDVLIIRSQKEKREGKEGKLT